MLGSILGAVAGPLVSGIFGSKKKETTTSTDWVKHRKSLQAAGYNPLTFGGAGAPTTTTSSPEISTGEWLGRAVSAGVETGFNHSAQQRQEATDLLQQDVLRAQLEQIQNENRALTQRDFGYSIPRATNYTGVQNAGSQNSPNNPSLAGLTGSSGGYGQPDDIIVGGRTVSRNDGWTDAGVITERYGEPAEWLYSPFVIAADGTSSAANYLQPHATRSEQTNLNFGAWGSRRGDKLTAYADSLYERRQSSARSFRNRLGRNTAAASSSPPLSYPPIAPYENYGYSTPFRGAR